MKPSVTGLVLTYNGGRLLEKCLASLSFCDKVLVVDSFSTDDTVAIATAAGATVLQRAWEGPGPQFQFAFSQIDTEWVVSLDQDEICTPALRERILTAFAEQETVASPAGQDAAASQARQGTQPPLAGYYVHRRNWYFDRFMQHSGWYPDALLRVFRPALMQVQVSGAHYSFHPAGTTQTLAADILHYPYESFAQHLDKINSYAQQGADDLRRKGRKGGVLRGIGHGAVRFAKLYFFQRGVLDGRAGFINAAHGAFYAFLKYVRVEEGSWGKPYDHQ
ncbi:glycosyltransferase family 2 protein [Desulfovibrio psychrotolerans]|uniref:Glycosyl transferase family 2 n=1 Tax=Desulfovibrio psychrotolerans TaxID=415242 RepID=A0A7J0BSJ8_9BACT|nr:glycosyltransferase family 2 protein [Desulfovibrio psychrotolerans]GFM36660.1 glycosyl transferase family 2 [Desulfovibrio psychrotolerans]